MRHATPVRLALAIGAAVLVAPDDARLQMAGMQMPVAAEVVYVCPFDESKRSLVPGTCAQRGRTAELAARVPEPVPFALHLSTAPRRLEPGQPARLRFEVRDPWRNEIVRSYTVVHEKLLHAFVVSGDLQYFAHEHPEWTDDAFELRVTLPKPGMYRVLTDFLPEAATPQLVVETLFVGSAPPAASAALARAYATKTARNLDVTLVAEPNEPVAGEATTLRFQLSPADGIEPYLGTAGHMLVASDDLIDLVHAHPAALQAGPDVAFPVVFARARSYRVWVQFQRNGVINTAHFDIPVRAAATPAPVPPA